MQFSLVHPFESAINGHTHGSDASSIEFLWLYIPASLLWLTFFASFSVGMSSKE